METKSSLSIKKVGFGLLLGGFFTSLFYFYPSTWPFSDFISAFYTNVSTEMISIAVTVLVIDYLYQRREDEELRYRLTWEMGSIDQGFTLRATKEMRSRGWLFDGTLKNKDLELANLEGADLKGANFAGTSLRKANLKGVHLENANLEDSDLTEAVLYEVHLEESNMINSQLGKARLQKAHLYRTNLKNADLLGAMLQGAELRNADLTNARLEETDLRNTDFTGAKLGGANLLRANLKGAILRSVDLRRADLSEIADWEEIECIENAQISGVINPPEGFLDWAEDEDAIL